MCAVCVCVCFYAELGVVDSVCVCVVCVDAMVVKVEAMEGLWLFTSTHAPIHKASRVLDPTRLTVPPCHLKRHPPSLRCSLKRRPPSSTGSNGPFGGAASSRWWRPRVSAAWRAHGYARRPERYHTAGEERVHGVSTVYIDTGRRQSASWVQCTDPLARHVGACCGIFVARKRLPAHAA